MSLVQGRMEEAIEVFVELLLVAFGQVSEVVIASHRRTHVIHERAANVASRTPIVQGPFGDGITEPEGHEVGRPVLTPMRQIAAVDPHCAVFVERDERRSIHGSHGFVERNSFRSLWLGCAGNGMNSVLRWRLPHLEAASVS